jgi:hypothetical protein
MVELIVQMGSGEVMHRACHGVTNLVCVCVCVCVCVLN